jgi:tRNA (cytidine/uridine-2'-O-)-methyltransferase
VPEQKDFMLNIALIHPDIPQNTGNVGRLCVGLGATLHLVRPMSFMIDDKKLKRAGLDYWKDLDLRLHESLERFLEEFAAQRLFFFTTKSKIAYTTARFQKDDCLGVGSESRGLPSEVLEKNHDRALCIPMFGPIRSLNLATSVGIVAYEAVRQITACVP